MSSVTYQVSSVTCCISPVTCHMSLTPTAIAMALALITPQLCTARCGCWSWSKPIDNESQRPKKSTIYALRFYHSWVKTAISDTNVISLLFLRESLCDVLISMLTFKDGSNKTFIKLCVKIIFSHQNRCKLWTNQAILMFFKIQNLQKNTVIFYFRTKDWNSNRLGVIHNYAPLDI